MSDRAQHRLRTPACPTLPRLVRAIETSLEEAERAHVVTCDYCQKVAAMSWRGDLACPPLDGLVSHLAGTSPWAGAMREHLADDDCRRCRLLTKSRLLVRLGHALAAGSRTWDEVRLALRHAAGAFADLPAQVGVFARDPWAAEGGSDTEAAASLSHPKQDVPDGGTAGGLLVSEASGPFLLRVERTPGLSGVLRATDRGVLVAHVESSDPDHQGRAVWIELVGEGVELGVNVPLEERSGRYVGQHTFGPLDNLLPQLGASCVFLVAATVGDL